MKPYLYDVVFSILFGFAAIVFLSIGLRGILTKRPFLISQRWLLSAAFAACIPALAHLLTLFPSGFNFMNWLFLLGSGAIIVMMCYQMRGYIVYGGTDPSFREILLKAIQKLQLPYEENLSLIRLTSVEADLQVSVQKWRGTGIIKIKQCTHRSVLKEIVNAMNKYFRMSSVSINMSNYVCCVIIGGFMVFTAIRMLSF